MIKEIKNLTTPCYILDKKLLDNNLQNMKVGFQKYWNSTYISYSVKTNSLPWLLIYLYHNGVIAEVVSPNEYKLVHALGYDDKKIVLNGPYKDFSQVRSILESGGIVNIDSPHEVEWLCNAEYNKTWKVGIRINFNLEAECPGETLMGKESGRFGLNIENDTFEKALYKLQKNGIQVIGLHTHFNTKSKSLSVYAKLAEKICMLQEKYNLDLEYIDIGGGFFGDKLGAPSYQEYAEVITSILKNNFQPDKTRLILEPGTALIASSFKYLFKIFDEKVHNGQKLLFADGSFVHTDFQLTNRQYCYDIINEEDFQSICENIQIVTGFTCMEKDRLLYLPPKSQQLYRGDMIMLHNVGAYTLNFVPLFIDFLPTVYVETEEGYYLVREKWGVEEYLMKNNCKLELI